MMNEESSGKGNLGEYAIVAVALACIIISVFSPMGSDYPLSDPWSPDSANDLTHHISGIIEAGNAIHSGQFPIRVVPETREGYDYPFFQFYGNFPYTLGGLLFIVTGNPYFSYKLVIMISLFIGAFCLFLFGRWVNANNYAAFIGSTIFLTAPYLLDDIYGRHAFTEIVAIGLLPPVFYYTFRVLQTKKLQDCLALTGFSVLLFHTHNVFSLYAILFLLLILGGYLVVNARGMMPVIGVIASEILALFVSSWYLIPQLTLVNDLVVSKSLNNPFFAGYLSSIWVVLAPSKIYPLPANYFDNPNLGFQVGIPLLICFVCGLYVMYRHNLSERTREKSEFSSFYKMSILMVCSGTAFVLVCSPFNFWEYLPAVFYFIQFPYRLLGFLIVFGAMICPICLRELCRNFQFQHAVVLFLFCMAFTGSYLPNSTGYPEDKIGELMANPDLGKNGAETNYLISPSALPPSPSEPEQAERSPIQRISESEITFSATRGGIVELPVLFYPGMILLTDNGREIPYFNIGKNIGINATAGDHNIVHEFIGVSWANYLSLGSSFILLVLSLFCLDRKLKRGK